MRGLHKTDIEVLMLEALEKENIEYPDWKALVNPIRLRIKQLQEVKLALLMEEPVGKV